VLEQCHASARTVLCTRPLRVTPRPRRLYSGGRWGFIPILHSNVGHKEKTTGQRWNCHHVSRGVTSWSTGPSLLCAPYPVPFLPAALGIAARGFRSREPLEGRMQMLEGRASALCDLLPQRGPSLGLGQSRTKSRGSRDSYTRCSLFKANKEAPTCDAESVILLPRALPVLHCTHAQLFQRQQPLRKKNTALFWGAARGHALQLMPLWRRRLEVRTWPQQAAVAHSVTANRCSEEERLGLGAGVLP